MYADVLFPLKLPALTYRIPEGMPFDIQGFIVKAQLGKRKVYGVVSDVRKTAPEGLSVGLKDLSECCIPFADKQYFKLIRWLSDYYLTPEGMALKSCFFEDFIKAYFSQSKKTRAGSALKKVVTDYAQSDCSDEGYAEKLSAALQKIRSNRYSASLACLKSSSDDLRFIRDIFSHDNSIKNAIVMIPEFNMMERTAACLRDIYSSRVCELHSRLTPAKRAEAVKRISQGEADIIVGTRSAVLAPMREVSLIIASQEHSSSYKAQEGMRYNARDVAVMRGYMHRASVLLTSIAPSLESVHNCTLGKYSFLGSNSQDISGFRFPDSRRRPLIKVVKISSKSGCFAQEVLKKSKDVLKAKESMLFMINRKGYSLIRCEECGETLGCLRCGVPYIFYKSGTKARCRLCGSEQEIPESCPSCMGFKLEPSGTGIERIKEELDTAFGTDAVMLQKTASGADKLRGSGEDEQQGDVISFSVGTAHAVRKIDNGSLKALVFISAESMIGRPDFRARERAFQEIIAGSELVKQGGSVFIQTYRKSQKFLRSASSYDFRNFYVDELADRRSLGYPPYSNIILFNIDNSGDSKSVEQVVSEISAECCSRQNDLLFYGPVAVSSVKGSRLQFFVKSRDSVKLHKAALSAIKRLDSIKIKYIVDVDPLKI